MGILDGLMYKVKSDLEWKAGQEVSTAVAKGATGVLKKGDNKAAVGKCPKCKANVEPGIKFCHNCGAKLTLTCEKCVVDYPIGTKFCTRCGAKLKE
jgi:membrane protease subunit (stomatin/prohibitin family)